MSLILKQYIQKFIAVNISRNQTCNFARWSHRRPMKVIPPESYDEMEKLEFTEEEKIKEEVKIKWRHEKPIIQKVDVNMDEIDERTFKTKQTKVSKPKINQKPTDMLETIIDVNGDFVYTKMANNDTRISMLLTTLKSKKEKMKKDLILLEGKRLIKEALLTGSKLKYILFTRKEELEYLKALLPKGGAQLYKMPYKEMQMWSDLTTCPGIMGIFKTPESEKFAIPKISLPLTVICDSIREPGNLGAIFRACAAVGCQKIILSKGCVNMWDSKVTRSAAGAHFRIQIHNKMEFNEIPSKLSNNVTIYIADNKVISDKENVLDNASGVLDIAKNMPLLPYYSIKYRKSDEIALIIGGETNGISLDSYKLAAKFNGVRLNIPLNNGVESLNTGTALGIISFEIKRQMALIDNQTRTKLNIDTDKDKDLNNKKSVPEEIDVSLGLRGI